MKTGNIRFNKFFFIRLAKFNIVVGKDKVVHIVKRDEISIKLTAVLRITVSNNAPVDTKTLNYRTNLLRHRRHGHNPAEIKHAGRHPIAVTHFCSSV